MKGIHHYIAKIEGFRNVTKTQNSFTNKSRKLLSVKKYLQQVIINPKQDGEIVLVIFLETLKNYFLLKNSLKLSCWGIM